MIRAKCYNTEEMIWPMFSINIQYRYTVCYIVDLSEMVCFNKIINYLFIQDCPRCFSQELKFNQMLAVRVTVYIYHYHTFILLFCKETRENFR